MNRGNCAAIKWLALAIVLFAVSSCNHNPQVIASGASYFPSSTASDWKSNSPFIVAATVTRETPVEPTEVELKRGEGMTVRHVSLVVDAILYRGTVENRQSAPQHLTFKAMGSVFKDGEVDRRYEIVSDGQPRLEVGHSYIIALGWIGVRCGEGDPTVPAHWIPLGEFGILPYDDGVIGNGELEGRVMSVDEVRSEIGQKSTLVDAVLGGSAETLVGELDKAESTTPAPGYPDMDCEG